MKTNNINNKINGNSLLASLNSGKKLAPYWVTGITDAEGNFFINKQMGVNRQKFTLAFKVTQKKHSMGILLALQKYFSCGNIQIDNRKHDTYKFQVTKLQDITNIIIPHFSNYCLLTSKHLDFLDFKKASILIKTGLHLKESGQNIILDIKNNMNNKRTYDKR